MNNSGSWIRSCSSSKWFYADRAPQFVLMNLNLVLVCIYEWSWQSRVLLRPVLARCSLISALFLVQEGRTYSRLPSDCLRWPRCFPTLGSQRQPMTASGSSTSAFRGCSSKDESSSEFGKIFHSSGWLFCNCQMGDASSIRLFELSAELFSVLSLSLLIRPKSAHRALIPLTVSSLHDVTTCVCR